MKRLRRIALFLLIGGCAGASDSVETRTTTPRRTENTSESADIEDSGVGRRRSPTSLELGVIQRIAREAELIRGLEFIRPVHIDVEDSARIAESLSSQVTENDIQRTKDVYRTLGLLPENFDVRGVLSELLGEQVLGYYDTTDARLVVREELMELLVREVRTRDAFMARLTLLHELIHALQDQQLGLGASYDLDLDDDRDLGLRALVEGDAMLALEVYAAELLDTQFDPQTVMARPVQLSGLTSEEHHAMRDAPPIIRATLVGQYAYGVRYAAWLYEQGGWPAINAAFRDEAPSFSQVMHLGQELEAPIVMPVFSSFEAYDVAEETSLGELEFAVYLANDSDEDVDLEAASGWRGDRLRIYRKGTERIALWWIRLSSELETQRAAEVARRQGGTVFQNGTMLMILRGLDELPSDVQQAFLSQ